MADSQMDLDNGKLKLFQIAGIFEILMYDCDYLDISVQRKGRGFKAVENGQSRGTQERAIAFKGLSANRTSIYAYK